MVVVKKVCLFANFYDFPKAHTLEFIEEVLPGDVEIFLFCPTSAASEFSPSRAKLVTYGRGESPLLKLREFCKSHHIDVVSNLGGSWRMAAALSFVSAGHSTRPLFCLRGNIFPKVLSGSKFILDRIPKDAGQLFLYPLTFVLPRFTVAAWDINVKLRRFFFWAKKKLGYLPTVIDTDLFHPVNRALARKKWGLLSNEKVVVSVGRVQFMKGSDYLLKVIKSNPELKFVLVGRLDDPAFNIKKLKNVIHHPKLTSKEINELYSAADVCLFLSRIEGCARVPREALAAGCPVIASNIEFNQTLIPAEKVPFDLTKINNRLHALLAQPKEFHEELGMLGRQFVIDEYSKPVLAPLYRSYFLNWKK